MTSHADFANIYMCLLQQSMMYSPYLDFLTGVYIPTSHCINRDLNNNMLITKMNHILLTNGSMYKMQSNTLFIALMMLPSPQQFIYMVSFKVGIMSFNL